MSRFRSREAEVSKSFSLPFFFKDLIRPFESFLDDFRERSETSSRFLLRLIVWLESNEERRLIPRNLRCAEAKRVHGRRSLDQPHGDRRSHDASHPRASSSGV